MSNDFENSIDGFHQDQPQRDAKAIFSRLIHKLDQHIQHLNNSSEE